MISWYQNVVTVNIKSTSPVKYGLVIPLCSLHHMEMHKNIDWQDYWHKKGQKAFIAYYPDLDFFKIFKINYLWVKFNAL